MQKSEKGVVSNKNRNIQTDVAALAAAVVAIAVSIFTTQGPYDEFGAIVALSTGLLIFGYVWIHKRTYHQSLAIASICAIITMPIIGFLFETILVELLKKPIPLDMDGKPQSLVPANWISMSWGVSFVIFLYLDRKNAKDRNADE